MKRIPGESKRILNTLKDIHDDRDYEYTKLAGIAMPDIVQVPGVLNAVIKNQGSIGSCVPHAMTTAFEIMVNKSRNIHLSELFLYYEARKLRGWEDRDSGLYPRDCLKAFKSTGAALEVHWPYNSSKFKEKPPLRAYVSARLLRIKAYYRIYSVDSIKYCLGVDKKPVPISLKVTNSFVKNRDGMIKMPKSNEKPVGNHEVCLVGYDKELGFRAINSWGPGWGHGGYCWIPFEFVQKYLNDAWTIEVY